MAANPSRALATARAAISPDGLVLLDLGGAMRRAGLDVRAALVIGFRSLPFESHAWVEVDGRVVNDRQQYRTAFTVIDRL